MGSAALTSSTTQLHAAFQSKSRPSGRRSALIARKAVAKVHCSQQQAPAAFSFGRREALIGLSAVVLGLPASQSRAEEVEFATFYGTASPPTSYGGYGGNAMEDAKYIFEYPATWKVDTINKVDKGTQGIDCRVFNGRGKAQQAFVITLGRAGEDNRGFKLTDIESTVSGFAGADYDMQDALVSATNKIGGTREIDGQIYYDYEIDSPDVHYLSSITFKGGRVFALFIKAPTKVFDKDEAQLRAILNSFHTT